VSAEPQAAALPAPRTFDDLQLASSSGEKVPDHIFKAWQREEQLLNAAIGHPLELGVAHVGWQLFDAPGHRTVWKAIQILSTKSTGGPLDGADVAAEVANIDPKHFTSVAAQTFIQSVQAIGRTTVKYALDTLVPELVARHNMRSWHSKFEEHYFSKVPEHPDVTALCGSFITEARTIGSTHDSGALALSYIDSARAWNATQQTNDNIVPTGIKQIDEASGGGHALGDLMVVGGGTGHAKSYFANKMCRMQAALGSPVLYVSVEDGRELALCRMLSDYSGGRVSPADIRLRKADPLIVDDAKTALAAEQQNGLVYFCEAKKWTTSQICDVIRRHRALAHVRMVIVDYVQAIQPDDPTNNIAQDLSFIIAELKRCATDCGVALVVMSQYNREGYRDHTEPDINSLKGSGNLENESEIVVLLWRDDTEQLHVKIAKAKWSRAQRPLRYLVEQHQVSGALGDWVEDHEEREPVRKRTNGKSNGKGERGPYYNGRRDGGDGA
jgi:replicative DNA helicase